MGTFSKSLASLGGFIAGDADIISYIKHHARAFIFSASISPANAAAALAAIQVMRREPERITRVNEIGERMRKAFRKMGLDTGHSKTPIVPIVIGDTQRTFITWKQLFQKGIFVNATIPPAVIEGRQLIRTSFMATHTEEQLKCVLETIESVVRDVGLVKIESVS